MKFNFELHGEIVAKLRVIYQSRFGTELTLTDAEVWEVASQNTKGKQNAYLQLW